MLGIREMSEAYSLRTQSMRNINQAAGRGIYDIDWFKEGVFFPCYHANKYVYSRIPTGFGKDC